MKRIIMEGKTFFQGTKVLSFLYNKNDQSYYMCQCTNCGHKFRQDGYSTRIGRQGCKHCRKSPNWNPLVIAEPCFVGDLTRLWWAKRVIAVVTRRQKRNPEFECKITMQYAWQKFLEQNGECKYTKIKLYFPEGSTGGTASLDRIDSSKGYIEGNVQWVHATVNTMKSDLTEEEFKKYCKLITDNNEEK